MVLKKNGKYWYGTASDDTRAEMQRYSGLNGYLVDSSAEAVCVCGRRSFSLETDEEVGVARRTCAACGSIHLMGDSADHAEAEEFVEHECICTGKEFELLSGISVYEGSNDVRWYYIGCRCVKCRLVGVFADWKCEGGDAAVFLTAT